MKLKILVVTLTGLLLQTQSCFGQKFSLSVLGGVTSSQISGDGFYGFNQFGGIAGVEVSYKFNEKWFSSLGLQFNQLGARTYPSEKTSIVYKLRVNYVEMPLLVSYHLTHLYFRAGVYLGVKTNEKERTSFGPVDPKRPFKTINFGGQLGLGYKFNPNWKLELIFQNSVLPVRPHRLDQPIPPALFSLGRWHQKLLAKGQYFTSLSFVVKYVFNQKN